MLRPKIQELPKELYQMDNKELQSFLCHSLREGACCALYSQGVPKERRNKTNPPMEERFMGTISLGFIIHCRTTNNGDVWSQWNT